MDFHVICGECRDDLTTSSAHAIREHALGLYSFLCEACSKTIV